jgi:AI-2 transport protein TqsA
VNGERSGDSVARTFLGVIATILVFAALREAATVFVPATFALFIIAMAWPLQRRLQDRLPSLVALLITVIVVLLVIVALVALMFWGFSSVAQWVIANAARFQDIYLRRVEWFEGHGIPAAHIVAEHLDMRSVAWLAQVVTGHLQYFVSMATVTLVFTMLGLLEVEMLRLKLPRLGRSEQGARLFRAGEEIAAKLQTYMVVRTLMSALTGLVIWAFALATGLELPLAWGVIAFGMNYIPFIGPLVATVFPTLFAALQFGSWEMAATVFVGLNLIQFSSGSYIEPRLAGRAVSISPFLVLFSVFFWSFLWGLPGAFIGIPATIATLTLLAHFDSTRWVADLVSGSEEPLA